MIDIYADADSLLAGPVDMGVYSLDARPLNQADHITGGKHPGHDLKFGGFRVQSRNSLCIRHAKPQFMLNSCFQCLFHSNSFIELITNIGTTNNFPNVFKKRAF